VLDKPTVVYRRGGSALDDGMGDAHDAPPAVGDPGAGLTSDRAIVRPLADVLGIRRVDAATARDAALIAARLAIRQPSNRAAQRGRSRPATVRFDGTSDELDLDRTLDLLAERRPFAAADLFVRQPVRRRRSVVLLADVSGSMDGVKARLTAAAVGALANELLDDELTVIAFWKDLAVLRVRQVGADAVALIDELLRIEPRGLTNVHAAIEQATSELARSSLEDRCVVLFSDCVHNAGPDPVTAARLAPRIHVLLERTGEHDEWLANAIAKAAGGRIRSATNVAETAVGLSALLAD
jgi:Mg-chelatase subunit ChlD